MAKNQQKLDEYWMEKDDQGEIIKLWRADSSVDSPKSHNPKTPTTTLSKLDQQVVAEWGVDNRKTDKLSTLDQQGVVDYWGVWKDGTTYNNWPTHVKELVQDPNDSVEPIGKCGDGD